MAESRKNPEQILDAIHQGKLNAQRYKMSQEEVGVLLDALRSGALHGRQIYRAVQVFGEQHYQAALPEVEALLQSDDFELRFVALKVLTRYWHLAEYWDTAYQVMVHDSEVECRFRAANDLGGLKANTQDIRTLHVLAQAVCNEQEEFAVRTAAYAAMLEVLHGYNTHEQLHIVGRTFDLATEVDWNLVKSYCEQKSDA